MASVGAGDSELVTKTLQIEHKLFYFDLKQNPRGRYLKISEKTSGNRSTIIVPIAGVAWFVELFNYYSSGEDAELASKELQLESKVFYFDVGENLRGRFLKVTESSVVRSRSTIFVPAGPSAVDGWVSFRNILVEILEAMQHMDPSSAIHQQATAPAPEIGSYSQSIGSAYVPVSSGIQPTSAVTDQEAESIAPAGATQASPAKSEVIRVDQKKFYFDMGNNPRGQYLKISEVQGTDRSSIILPVSAIEQFHETLGHFVETVKAQGLGARTTANVRTIAAMRKRTT